MSKTSTEVIERRLRPIYNNLEMGFPKKAVQEADRLLKKQPDLIAARPLKALALLRLGRNDEANVILTELEKLSIDDEFALQHMSSCFKELHEPQRAVKMYESAAKLQPQNLELLSRFFMSAVRVFDFKLQQRIGLQMHKLNPRNPYYFWTVMSVFMQGVADPETGKKISFPLAEKMIVKCIDEGKIEVEAEMKLLLMLYEETEAYEPLLSLLDRLERSDICGRSWLPQHKITQRRGDCLLRLKRWEELFNWALHVFQEAQPSYDWQVYANFIEAAEKLPQRRQEALDVIDSLREKMPPNERGITLASLAAAVKLNRSNAEVLGFLATVLEQYGKKMCGYLDLATFLDRCNEEVLTEFRTNLVPDWRGFREKGIQAELAPMYSALTVFRLHFRLRKNWTKDDYENFARCILKIALGFPVKTEEEEDAAEFQTLVDAFLILVIDTMLTAQRELKVYEQFSLTQELLVIIHRFLSMPNRPMNFQLVVVALKLYAAIGCSTKMTALIETLEPKYTQREALAHFYFDYLLPWGLMENHGKFARVVLHTGEQARKEVTECLVTSYRQGKFETARDMYRFSDKFRDSLMQAIAFVESQFSDLIEGEAHPAVDAIAEPPVILPVEDYVLNLDFDVLQSCSGKSSASLIELYVQLVRKGLAFKQQLLMILRELASLVGAGKGEGGGSKLSESISCLRAKFEDWKSAASARELREIAVDAPVIPPHDVLLNGSYVEVVYFWLDVAAEFAVTGAFQTLQSNDQAKQATSILEPVLRAVFAEHQMREMNGDVMAFPYRQLCHLSYVIWALALGVVVQEVLQPSCFKKGKKKKQNDNQDQALRQCCMSQLSALESTHGQLLDLNHFLYANAETASLLGLEEVKEWYPAFHQTRDTAYGMAIEQSLRVVDQLIARQKNLLK